MLVLKANVLLNNGDTSRQLVFPNRCTCHIRLRFVYEISDEQNSSHSIHDVDEWNDDSTTTTATSIADGKSNTPPRPMCFCARPCPDTSEPNGGRSMPGDCPRVFSWQPPSAPQPSSKSLVNVQPEIEFQRRLPRRTA